MMILPGNMKITINSQFKKVRIRKPWIESESVLKSYKKVASVMTGSLRT